MDDSHILRFVDVETGNLIPEDERDNMGKITLDEQKLSELRSSADLSHSNFILNEAGEKVTYNGELITLKSATLKLELLQSKRKQYFQINLLCIIMQLLILW